MFKRSYERPAHSLKPGDVYVLNNPYNGGTHLPDITVVTPVFDSEGTKVIFYVGSRAHHADIGGVTPGSMPPYSTSIEEEGVLIDTMLLVRDDLFFEDEIRLLLTSGPHSVRNVEQNIADLKAQVAANNAGVCELEKLVARYGLPAVHAYMRHVQDNAESAVRAVIEKLSDGDFCYELDDGSQIQVRVTVDHAARSATIDFTGTSPKHPTNFNAPSACVKAAVLYVFRALVDDEIPLNAGCLKPVEIIIPEGSMLNVAHPAAVVAGNVETSQYIVDALFSASGILAPSQGTMNNFTFGSSAHQYYETIGGGAGAGPTYHGTDAVHTHMTNSRLTDPEVLEWRYPVRLESCSIRRGSGGEGAYRGGDGLDRRVRFLEPMTASILSSHRTKPPHGLHGGGPAETGKNWIERSDGSREGLTGTATVEMNAGDLFVIQTPGGGGYGRS